MNFSVALAQEPPPPPAYLSLSASIHDFELFANGGWDGNWYVGYNSMWIVELPSAPAGNWSRAFIGAKLGRMKSEQVPGSAPWIREPIACEIFMAISATAAWKTSESYFLVPCEDIPLEGSAEDAIRGVGESQWFWREVPLRAVNFVGKNYLAIWSPTENLTSAAQAPIIAASAVKGAANAWLNRSIQGIAPTQAAEALETRLHAFAPSLALKLIPEDAAVGIEVNLIRFKEAVDVFQWEVQVEARNFTRVRPELSLDSKNWVPFGRSVYQPPFIVTLPHHRLKKEAMRIVPSRRKPGQVYLRITAWDEWENSASTSEFLVYLK